MDFTSFKKTETKSPKKRAIIKKRVSGVLLDTLFFDNEFYVDYKNKLIKIDISIEDINKVKYLYSLPDNDYYEDWYMKPRKRDINLENTNDFTVWHILRPKMKVKGRIINNKFILNYEFLNDEHIDKIYKRFIKQIEKDVNKGIRTL